VIADEYPLVTAFPLSATARDEESLADSLDCLAAGFEDVGDERGERVPVEVAERRGERLSGEKSHPLASTITAGSRVSLPGSVASTPAVFRGRAGVTVQELLVRHEKRSDG
jgi:hypothetical protein